MQKLTAAIVIVSLAMTVFGQARPDLVVSGLVVNPDATGRFVAKVSVTVSNDCRGSETAASFVMITFRESAKPGSKAIYFVGRRVNALKGGERQTLTFDATTSGKQVALDRHVLAEVDPYGKIAEASENNNWRTINPNAAGSPQCKPGR